MEYTGNPVAGVGTKFFRWNPTGGGSAGIWEKISQINTIDGPSKSKETIDVTSLDSTDGYREFISSFKDGGEVSLSMNFTRDTYDVLDGDFEDDELHDYEIVLPDAENTSMEFSGVVTGINLTSSVGDKITADVTIKISGKPVINSGSGSS